MGLGVKWCVNLLVLLFGAAVPDAAGWDNTNIYLLPNLKIYMLICINYSCIFS